MLDIRLPAGANLLEVSQKPPDNAERCGPFLQRKSQGRLHQVPWQWGNFRFRGKADVFSPQSLKLKTERLPLAKHRLGLFSFASKLGVWGASFEAAASVLDLLDLVAGAEAVEGVHEGHPAPQGGDVRGQGEVQGPRGARSRSGLPPAETEAQRFETTRETETKRQTKRGTKGNQEETENQRLFCVLTGNEPFFWGGIQIPKASEELSRVND